MPALRVRCPAKINTVLQVLGLRPDGYHELDTEFVSLSISDELALEKAQGFSLVVEGAPPERVPVEDNLVLKAARALQASVGEGALPGARFHLVKRIPAAGGLGGGSSDAAGALAGLVRLHGLEVPAGLLSELALAVGSDVPYFLRGGRQRGRSRGEALEPLPDRPDVPVVLVNPGLPLATRDVFRAWDAKHQKIEGGLLTSRKTGNSFPDNPWWDAEDWPLHNDLWDAARDALPALADVERKVGARLPGWRLSLTGSGPTLFALPGPGTPAPGDELDRALADLAAAGMLALRTRTLAAAEYEATRFSA